MTRSEAGTCLSQSWMKIMRKSRKRRVCFENAYNPGLWLQVLMK